MPINITVSNRIAQAGTETVIVNCNSDYIITFTFDSEWTAFTEKTAVFQYRRNGNVVTEHVPFSGSICPVPVITDTDEVLVGVYAGSIQTAAPARIPCCRSVTDCPTLETASIPDTYNRIMEFIANHTTVQT